MADIAELERRVTALEAKQDRTTDDIAAIKRDMRKLALVQDDMRESMDELNRRVAVIELTVKAVDAKVDRLAETIGREMGEMRQELGEVKSGLRKVEDDVTALRRDLPGMLVDAIRAAK